MARPAAVHPILVREARALAARKVGTAEARRRLIPLASRLGVERPSYSLLRELFAEERFNEPVDAPRPSALRSVVAGRVPSLLEAEELLVEKPRRRRLRS